MTRTGRLGTMGCATVRACACILYGAAASRQVSCCVGSRRQSLHWTGVTGGAQPGAGAAGPPRPAAWRARRREYLPGRARSQAVRCGIPFDGNEGGFASAACHMPKCLRELAASPCMRWVRVSWSSVAVWDPPLVWPLLRLRVLYLLTYLLNVACSLTT